MDLREALHGYVVTAVPQRCPSLSIVWSPADDKAVDDQAVVGDAAGSPDEAGLLAILDDYRITRVPKAS